MFKRMSLYGGLLGLAVACVGCSAGARVSMFDDDHPRKARVVRYEERHVCTDDCDLEHHGRIISGEVDVDIDD